MRAWIFGLAVVGLFAVVAAAAPAGEKKPEVKKKLLVITQSKGFVHDVVKRPKPDELCLVEQILTEIGQTSGDFEVTCSQDARKEITAENLKNYDAVFFYTTGELELSDVQKADLLEFVRSGKGFAGTHSATDTFYKWPEYGNLIGGYFDGHPWNEKVKVVVEDTKHPATKHLGESFEIADEIYQFKGPYDRSKLHILMHLDTDSVKKTGKREDKDYAVAWTKEYEKGRVFYTSLGHRAEVWKDERYQKHLLGGLRYVLGIEKADAKPSAPSGK
jgi:type 1 glutamine amidotransferase